MDGKYFSGSSVTNQGSLGGTGTVNGSNPTLGILGQGRYFNANSQYIAITPGTSYQFANQTFTVSGWIKGGSEMSSAAGMVIAQGGCSGGWYVQVSSVVNFTLKGSGTCGGVTLTRSSGVTVNDNKWHQFVIVATTSTTVAGNISASIYVDGVLNQGAQSVDGSTYATSNAELDIGARDTGGGPYFAGNVDDLRIYNRGLSSSEIALLYKTGQVKVAVTPNKTVSGLSNSGISKSLTGYWTFDGKDTNWNSNTTNDVTGQNSAVTLTGFSTSSSPGIGVVGQSFTFNGSTSYIVLPDNLIKNTVTPTVSLWFRTSTGGGLFGYQDVATLAGGATQWVPILYVGSNGRLFGQFWNGSINVMNTIPTVNDGKWHHAVITGNTNTQSLYFDGALVSTIAGTINNLVMSKNQVGVANEAGSWPLQNVNGWDYFKGQIDDVRTYNRALSTNEIQQLYKLGQARVAKSPVPAPDDSKAGLSNGLAGYWTMDGKDINWRANTIADKSANGITGTFINMSTTTSPVLGKLGQAINFVSGVSQYINLGSNSSLRFGQNVSVSAWVYPTVANMNGKYIFTFDSGACCGINYALGSGISGSAGHFGFVINVSGQTTEDPSTYTPNKWYHLVGTYDGSTINFYSNGALIATRSYSSSMSLYNNNIATIGGAQTNGAAGSNLFDGYIDDVRVYGRTLSASEVSQLYKLGTYKTR